MKSLCKKCGYCKYALRIRTDWSREEFDRGEWWYACGYTLSIGTRRPCPGGAACAVFQCRSRPAPSVRSGIASGVSFYSYYQRVKKRQPGDAYTPQPGDVISFIDTTSSYRTLRYVVSGVDDKRVYYFSGACKGPTLRHSANLEDRLIIGYQTPAAAPEDQLFLLADGQRRLGVPPSGRFTEETRRAIHDALNGGISLDVLWPIFLVCLGYGPNDTERFQKIEDLPQTGFADWASWRRACLYLSPLKRSVHCQNAPGKASK